MSDDAPDQPEPPRADSRPDFDEFTLTSERDGDGHMICVFGELDVATAGALEAELQRVEATDARPIVVDLSGLTFMDSTGIRLLVAADARARADSDRLRLRRGPHAVQRVVELSGLDDVLPFVD